MEVDQIAKIYYDDRNANAPSVSTFFAMAKHDKALAAKERAEAALLKTLSPKQQKRFESYQNAWTELDTLLELEAFRQGLLSAEQKSGHSLKIEGDR